VEAVALCVRCRGEFTKEQIAGVSSCPRCESKGVPADPRERVAVTLTWHELRLLVIWAENWAARCDETEPENDARGAVYGIARAIEEQHPSRAAKSALTLSGELAQLREKYPSLEVVGGNITPGNKPPEVQ
jgi:hypothetical protein